jgi:glucose/arabinose dehydrogenase
MRKYYHFLFFFFSCLTALPQPEITLDLYGTGFSSPVAIRNAGDDRLFIVERAGRIKIINSNGSINGTPFLDIDSIVDNSINPGQEGGLLGLAFHPDYQSNGYFYVNYTNNSGDTVISRFTVSLNADLANSNSQLILLTIDQPYSNHNGGDIAFGPDGYLYIGTGDGGSGGDPQNRAQNLNSLLGKMLRIDVDSGSPYTIPTDNPYLNDGDSSTLSEIWAYGLRNPWRFSFDSQSGDLWTADVGQGTYEEINRVSSATAEINYGWRCYEANATYNTSGCPPMNTLTFPIGTYSHSGGAFFRCSISGGYVYRGSENPNFSGVYFFADYCSNEIGTLAYDGNNWNMSFTSPYNGEGWVSFGNDMAGELYIAGMNSGNIYKLIDSTLGIGDVDDHGFTMFPNPTRNELTFDFKNTLPIEIKIYDIQGKVVQRIDNITDLTFSLSVEQFSEGLYVVKAQDVNGLMSYKKLLIK